MIHFTVRITEGIPILSHGKVRFGCIHVVLYITTPKSSDKVKPPPIISNFISENDTELEDNILVICNTLLLQIIFFVVYRLKQNAVKYVK
jgi:hypothetical protein